MTLIELQNVINKYLSEHPESIGYDIYIWVGRVSDYYPPSSEDIAIYQDGIFVQVCR